MAKPVDEIRHAFVSDLMTMSEAALMACIHTDSRSGEIPEAELNAMAGVLTGLVAIFSMSRDRGTIRQLTKEEILGGAFSRGGRQITFVDGRRPITGLFLTRSTFKGALEVLEDAEGFLGSVPSRNAEVGPLTSPMNVPRYGAGLAGRRRRRDRKVKGWHAAGRATLLVLLGFSALQYYVLDVYLTIMNLSRLTFTAGLP